MLSTQIISLIKRLLGDVEIKKSLGSSSLGISYLIQHPKHGLCTLKILKGKVTQNEKFLLKFLRDLETNCKVFHPGIAEIFAIMKKGNYFILRQYQEGQSLRQKVQKHKKISEPEATDFLIQIVEALREFCTQNQALKNLKPNNLIFHDDGIKITDYSLPPTIAHFLSPEQCKGKKSTIQSDIYTLGAIYYYCLTGQTLYHGPYTEIMQAHIAQPHPKIPSNISAQVVNIINKMLNKDPEKRYSSYEKLLKDLNQQTNTKDSLDFTGASNLEKTIDIQVALMESEDDDRIDTTRKLVRDMIKKELQVKEEATILEEKKSISLEQIVKKLEEITDLQTTENTMSFPTELKNDVLLYLQEKFNRKCWIFNHTSDSEEIDLEIDLQNAIVFQHLYSFEEQLKKIILEYKNCLQNSRVTDFSGLQQCSIRIVHGDFSDQKHLNIENSTSSLSNSKVNMYVDVNKENSKEQDNYDLPQLASRDETIIGNLSHATPIEKKKDNDFESDLTIVGNNELPQEESPDLDSDATLVGNSELPELVKQVESPDLDSDATLVGNSELPELVKQVESPDLDSDATLVGNNELPELVKQVESSNSSENANSSVESPSYFELDSPILGDGNMEEEQNSQSSIYFETGLEEEKEFGSYFSSDATIVSEKVSEVAEQIVHKHPEEEQAKNGYFDEPEPEPEPSFTSDATVVSDAINKVAEAIQTNSYFESDTFSANEPTAKENISGFTSKENTHSYINSSKPNTAEPDTFATDMTVVGGNISDFVSKEHIPSNTNSSEPNATESDTFVTDMTVAGGNISDFISKEHIPSNANSSEPNVPESDTFSTDMTVAGGNISDFISKEHIPSNANSSEPNAEFDTFATDMTVAGGNISDFISKEHIPSNTNSSESNATEPDTFATDMTVVGGNISDFVSKEHIPSNANSSEPNATEPDTFATDMTVVGGNISDFVSKENPLEKSKVNPNTYLPPLNPSEGSFATDMTVVGGDIDDIISKKSSSSYAPETYTPPLSSSSDSFATDMTVVGNLSDFVAKDATPSYIDSNIKETTNSEESISTDMTVVGANVSDFASKDLSSTPSYLESEKTVVNNNNISQIAAEASVDESMATDMTVVGNNITNFVSKEPDSSLELETTIVSTSTVDSENAKNANTLDKKTSISTTETRIPEKSSLPRENKKSSSVIMQVSVDFTNEHEAQSWETFVEENDLRKGENYALVAIKEPQTHIYSLKIDWALHYYELKQKSTSIKDFFQSDYEISELGRGGMGMVLKLTTKFDGTILSLRPENNWAREYFTDHLCVRSGINNQEIVYAELPAGKSFVVKVAFKGCEESLIHEGNCLEKIAQRAKISDSVVGLIQQGCLMAKNHEDNSHLGYYAMMEYGGDIAVDQLCKMFPDKKLPITVGFMLLYGLTRSLMELKEEGVIHRDIKPQNILLTDDGMPKLFDFGLAVITHPINSELNDDNRRLLRVLDSDFLRISTECELVHKRLKRLFERKVNMQEFNEVEMNQINNKIASLENTHKQLQEREYARAYELQHLCRPVTAEENVERAFAGSLYYAAPEQFKPANILTHQCDVYQLGSTLFTVLTGQKVVSANSLHELIEVILYSEKPKLSDHLPKSNLVEALSELLTQMMCNNPQERIKIENVHTRLNKILFNHLDELTKPPIYDASKIDDPELRSEYYRKIAFVQRMFMKCLRNLHAYLDKLKKTQQSKKKIFFSCPSCTKKLHISAKMMGKKGCCPNCRHPIVVQLS